MREGLSKSIRRVVKRLLPASVLQEARKFRACDTKERSAYLKVRISNGLGWKNPKTSVPPKTAHRFLFVCFGNIMRSPMCEVLMNRELVRIGDAEFTATSAGLNASPGTAAHPWAIAAAQKFGVSLEHHRAQRVTRAAIDQADAIFAMDCQNQVQLLARWPDAGHKVFMLAAYAGPEYESVEIPDPYYQDQQEARLCFETLNTCIRNLAHSLEIHSCSPPPECV